MSKAAADLVPVQEHHIQSMLRDMRGADRAELEAINGGDVERELRTSIASSERVRACVAGETLLAIFGDVRYDANVGLPWMVSTVHIAGHARAFLAQCRPVVADMQSRHLVLMNMSHAENRLANRWLKWLGFQFHDAVPFGRYNELFYPFYMERR